MKTKKSYGAIDTALYVASKKPTLSNQPKKVTKIIHSGNRAIRIVHSGDRAKRVESAEVAAALGAGILSESASPKVMKDALKTANLTEDDVINKADPFRTAALKNRIKKQVANEVLVPLKDLKAVLKVAERCINFLIANDTFTYGSLCVDTEYFLAAYNKVKKLVKVK